MDKLSNGKKQTAPVILIVMGVSGSGKSTVGKLLAQRLSCEFSDADSFHPAANVQKMTAGIPLTDSDRQPWLQSLKSAIAIWLKKGQSHVLACSALKSSYRDQLQEGDSRVHFIYLKATPALIEKRLSERINHYMKAGMASSQFSILEEPSPEQALVISAAAPLIEIVNTCLSDLKLS